MPLSQYVQRDTLGKILDGELSVEWFETEDFTGDNRTIFRRMLDVLVNGEALNHANVAAELMENDELEKCGGLSYLFELSQGRAGPSPMLQPWHCDACNSRGLLECISSDDVLICAREIAMLHAIASPHCHEEHGAGKVRCGKWREAKLTL